MINGFFIVDKPAGITSHDVVSRVRRILGTRKVGHTGTLDPFATGVLPVAVNEATKVIPFLDEGSKCYEALLRLGVTTDTLDMTGTILSESDPSCITSEQFLTALSQFTGTISQIPPMYSAIKQNGQPLYKLARQGIEVERNTREVEIYSIELLCFYNKLASVRVSCSRGTYIRTLADDIGKMLGCGAALQELRRVASGPFSLENAVTIEMLQEAEAAGRTADFCISPFMALGHLVNISLTAAGMNKVSHGKSPEWGETDSNEPFGFTEVALARLSSADKLVAVAEIVHGIKKESRLVLKRVFN